MMENVTLDPATPKMKATVSALNVTLCIWLYAICLCAASTIRLQFTSPFAGKVVTLPRQGSIVQVGEVLLVLEAMKMNTNILAPPVEGAKHIRSFKVEKLYAGEGDLVKEDQILMVLMGQ